MIKKKKAHDHHQPTRSSSSCAACKLLKRRCGPNCIFAPYFRADEPKKFAQVHKVFGASNVSKILNEVPEEQREDTVNSLSYEAEARLRDPVYGCIGAIALLQRRMVQLQHDVALARARLARYSAVHDAPSSSSSSAATSTCFLGLNECCCTSSSSNLDGTTCVNNSSIQLPLCNGLDGVLISQSSELSPVNDFGQVPLLPL